jgi:hypothetical protein
MKSKLIALGAAGAMLIALVPAVSAANPPCDPTDGVGAAQNTGVPVAVCDTTLNLTVTLGTTIWAPASINIGSNFPGQYQESAAQIVEWLSNETLMELDVSMAGLAATNASTHKTIANDQMYYVVDPAGTPVLNNMATPYTIAADLVETGATFDTKDHQHFAVGVDVPSVVADNDYTGLMTFAVVDPL